MIEDLQSAGTFRLSCMRRKVSVLKDHGVKLPAEIVECRFDIGP